MENSTEDRRHNWWMFALCLIVLLHMLDFFYDLYRSTGKHGELISALQPAQATINE